MACILGVGIATLDIVNHVARYPQEDEELRALGQSLRRGGNVTNTLAVLAQFGHHARWAGTLGDDADSQRIRACLDREGIDTRHVTTVPGGHAPTSYVTLSRATGSRSIVHYRDLPEYPADDFRRIDLTDLDWLHVEGRNTAALSAMLRDARQRRPELPISLEIEKPREGLSALHGLADLLLYSRPFALHHLGTRARGDARADAEDFLRAMREQEAAADLLVCAWGEHGAFALDRDGRLLHAPAVPPPRIVDTLGAGDTFNAGLIHARLAGQPPQSALRAACALAGRKVGQQGLAGLTSPEKER